jgi:pimeloyl-ACP methyl ester carboxylesterase
VVKVFPGTAGEAGGFQAGDVILTLDGAPVTTTDQFVRDIARHLGGEAVKIGVRHGTEETVRTAVLKPRPLETSPNADVLYRSVEVGGAKRRVIVTKPHKEGRLPAVLFMQGLGCYSLDGTDRRSGYGRVIDALEQRGYVTMRVEKTGEGDSEGPLCTDLGSTPAQEAAGYVAGLRALKQYDFVDPARVFVFAHSMGPIVGSMAVAEEPVRGFIAVETVGTSWYEYDLERVRVQAAVQSNPEEVDREVREYEPCSHGFYVEKKRPDQLKGCEYMFLPFGPVPYTYMQSVADISLGRQWRGGEFPVLVIYGTASVVTTAHQSRYLAELINKWRPGRAQYVEVAGMDHGLARVPGGEFHTGLLDAMFRWLEAIG